MVPLSPNHRKFHKQKEEDAHEEFDRCLSFMEVFSIIYRPLTNKK
jgi:hypothetical protein